MRATELPGGDRVPVLGQGTWRMGEDRKKRAGEVKALRTGLDLGLTLIDTAEMYADGGAEEVVGEAIKGRRDDVFVVTKCYPQNATPEKMRLACERSLRRLGTDRVDLYLVHWRGSVPLRQTLDGFDALHRDGKIRHAGVSNFDVNDSDELARLKGWELVVANEVLYNLEKRGAELDLFPWWRKRHRPVIAYSPVEEGLLTTKRHHALAAVAERHDATAAQVALAWTIREPGVIAIPKAANVSHVKENAEALMLKLTKRDLDELDASFAPPSAPVPLETR
jgi:diketogulonate reductase-like aldo/keto reductase